MTTIDLIDELKIDYDSGLLKLENLKPSERELLSEELTKIKNAIYPLVSIVRSLEFYSENDEGRMRIISEQVLGGKNLRIPSATEFANALETSDQSCELIRHILKTQPKVTNNPHTLSLISSTTLNEHLDSLIAYIQRFGC